MECEIPEFSSIREPVARAPRKCCECLAPIDKGEKYVYVVMKFDGELETFSQHTLCADACRAIRDNDGECIPFGDLKEWLSEARPWKDDKFLSMMRVFWARIQKRERKVQISD